MPEYINNVQTQNGYVDPCTFPPDIYTTQIVFDIGNNPVLMQVWRPDPTLDGKYILDENEALYTAGLGYILTDVAGFRVRSATPGSPAQLIAKRFLDADQKLTPGLAFTGTITPNGALQPDIPPASPLVQVEHNGGAAQGPEPNINLIDSAAPANGQVGLTWTAVDNAGGQRVDVTPNLSLAGVPVKLADSGVLAGAAGSIDFSGIPATFMTLLIDWYGRTSGAVTIGNLLLRLNNDSGTNYDDDTWYFDNAGALVIQSGAQNATSNVQAMLAGANAGANLMGGGRIEIPGYAGTTFQKIIQGDWFASSSGTVIRRGIGGGRWGNTAAVNRVTIFPATGNFVAGSRAILYGI